MAQLPPPDAIAAMLGPSSRIIRRVDIYEEDGTTLWLPNAPVTGGTLSVDQARPERRTIDLTFDNTTGQLASHPGGLWYDKVLKIYRGVQWEALTPSSLYLTGAAGGYLYTPDAPRLSWGPPFDLVLGVKIALDDWTSPTSQTLVAKWDEPAAQRQWAFQINPAGRPVLLWSTNGTNVITFESPTPVPVADRVPLSLIVALDADTGTGTAQATFYASPDDGLTLTELGTDDHPAPVTGQDLAAPVTIGAHSSDFRQPAKGTFHNAEIRRGETGPTVTALDLTELRGSDRAAVDVDHNLIYRFAGPGVIAQGGTPTTMQWETQLGEFMIDRIESPHFPHSIHLTGRDYTKKLIEDKLPHAIAFAEDTPVEDIVRAVAINGNVTRLLIPATGQTLARTYTFEANTDRWTIIEEVATAHGHEVFFDTTGTLEMREFQDPVTSPQTFTFETGAYGTLAAFKKSASDARMHNVVVVTGERSDQLPIIAIAENHEPSSPTSIERFKRRKTLPYKSAFVTSQEQAQQLADSILATAALESFELSLDSLVIPWIDAGDIVEFIDPRPNPGEPDKYLLSSFSIPMKLGTMSAAAKRITKVG